MLLLSPAVLLLLAFLAGLWAISIRSRKGKGSLPLPPGPWGLPIIGNLHMLGTLPHRSLQKLAQKYGPLMYVRLGKVEAIIVSSPELAELFLKTHDSTCANRVHTTEASKFISYGQKSLLFAPYGPHSQRIRKLLILELLNKSKVEMFKPMRQREVGQMVDSIKAAAGSRSSVDVSAMVGTIIENITFQMIFGFKDDKYNLKETIQESLTVSGLLNMSDYIPGIAPLDLQRLRPRMTRIRNTMDDFLEMIITEHEKDAESLQGRHRDFIDVILSLMDPSNPLEKQRYERDHIKAIVIDILTGSLDTSSIVVEWTMANLLKHPRVMKLLQQELKTVVGLDRLVEEADLPKLEYLRMVIKESMRLHAPPPFLYRMPSEDLSIKGYLIPKNSRVMINIWAMARDPNVWSQNAQEFYPERFIGTSIENLGHDFQFLPFGSGRRTCPALQLGQLQVELVVANLVHCFDFELPKGMSPEDIDMKEIFGLTSPRANHVVATPTCRLN